jgi:hypothetical protein
VLYRELAERTYRDVPLPEKNSDLRKWLGGEHLELVASSDDEWDAAISAYAALQGIRGRWTHDLHTLPTRDFERLIWPAGPTQYYWPV